MENSKLVALLRTFSSQEWRQFLVFLESPYFNSREEVLEFSVYLSEHAPELKGEALRKDRVHAHLFPKRAYDAKRMGYLMNYLLKLGEQFLGMQRLVQSTLILPVQTMVALSERGLDKHFQFLHNKLHKEVMDEDQQSLERFKYQHRLADLKSTHASLMGEVQQEDLRADTIESLNQYYILEALKTACQQFREDTEVVSLNGFDYLELANQYLAQERPLPPLIDLYYQLYQALYRQQPEQGLDRALDLMRIHADRIDPEERSTIFEYGAVFALRKFRKGEEAFAAHALDFLVEGIRYGAFREHDFLQPKAFLWAIRLQLHLGDVQAAKAFHERYFEDLAPELQHDLGTYTEGLIAYHEKNYPHLFELLQPLDFDLPEYRAEAEILLIKACYARDQMDQLLTHLADLTLFLRRDKELEVEYRNALKEFCHFLHQILRRNPKKRQVLGRQINRAYPLRERMWLWEVLEEEVEA